MEVSLSERWRQLRAWMHETDYARQRMLELRSGGVLTEETRRRVARAQIADLNDLFTAEAITSSADGEREPLNAPYQDRRDDRSRLDRP
jgi:hypothetical protein